MMHTWKMRTTIKDAVFGPYFAANTTDARCMYNTANFYIRNTMTGIRKSPEERTANETEVLHYVFTGIQKAKMVEKEKCLYKHIPESWVQEYTKASDGNGFE